MNIQLPLLLVGITATTGIGAGTIAVNTGAVSIDDLALMAAPTDTVSDISTPVDVLVPVLDVPAAPTPTADLDEPATDVTESTVGGTDSNSNGSSTKHKAKKKSSASTESNATSGGSSTASGGGRDDDDDDDDDDERDHEDHEDHDDHEDEDDD